MKEYITEVLNKYKGEIINWKEADEVLPEVINLIEYVRGAVKDEYRLRALVNYVMTPFIEKKLKKKIASKMLSNLRTLVWGEDTLKSIGFTEAEGIASKEVLLGYLLIIMGYGVKDCPEFTEEILEAYENITMAMYITPFIYFKGIHRWGEETPELPYSRCG